MVGLLHLLAVGASSGGTGATESNVSSFAWIIIAVAVLFAGSVASYSKFSSSSVKVLRANNEDLAKRVTFLEQENTRQSTAIEHLEAENELLKGLVQGTSAIAALSVQLEASTKQILDAIAGDKK